MYSRAIKATMVIPKCTMNTEYGGMPHFKSRYDTGTMDNNNVPIVNW